MTAIKLDSGGVIHPNYIEHAKNSFLPEAEVDAFIAACGQPLRKSIRVNRLKSSVADFKIIAADYGWRLSPIPWCQEGFWIETGTDSIETLMGNIPEHIQGLFYIQEASSMLPPSALLAGNQITQPMVVDMAAAPGSKTTQLAAMLNNQGLILANELSASRLKFLSSNLIRCGIKNTAMSHHDARKIGLYMPEQFDYVLLDAPCGGEGTVRKDINALKNWSLDKVKKIGQLQKELILSAYAALKPGGKMVYSTCTLSPEENQQIADYLVAQTNAVIEPLNNLFDGAEKAVSDKGYLLLLPHQFDSEGFFIACFSKPHSTEKSTPLKPIFTSPFIKVNAKIAEQVSAYFKRHFGLQIENEFYQMLQRDKEIWLFPRNISSLNCFIKVNRAGLKIAEVYPNKIRSTHEFACCLGDDAVTQKVALNKSQLEQFWRGLNIEIGPSLCEKGEVLLTYKERVVGIGQNQKGKVKNGLPRELVKDNFKLA